MNYQKGAAVPCRFRGSVAPGGLRLSLRSAAASPHRDEPSGSGSRGARTGRGRVSLAAWPRPIYPEIARVGLPPTSTAMRELSVPAVSHGRPKQWHRHKRGSYKLPRTEKA